MDKWTTDPSSMFGLRTSTTWRSATSSAASADGRSPSSSPDGRKTGPSGPPASPASPSPSLASASAPPTSETSGPSSAPSSRSEGLQRSLENRLRARLAGLGSPLYALTWKRLAMPLGPPVCRLAASALRTSDTDFSGWPSPHANSSTGSGREGREGGMNIQTAAQLTGWPTPTSQDSASSGVAGYPPTATHHSGTTLTDAARMAWPTPTVGNATGSQMSRDASPTGRKPDGSKATVTLPAIARLTAPWPTTRAADGEKNVRTLEGSMAEIARKGSPQDLAQAGAIVIGSLPRRQIPGNSTRPFPAGFSGFQPRGTIARLRERHRRPARDRVHQSLPRN